LEAIIALSFITFLIYIYIKSWIWLGGKIGGFIGSLIDACHNSQRQSVRKHNSILSRQNNYSMGIDRGQLDRTYFDRVLDDIQCKKRRNE